MEHTYTITFKSGTTKEQILDMLESVKGGLSRDFGKTTLTFTLETTAQPMDILFGPHQQIIQDCELIGFTGETI